MPLRDHLALINKELTFFHLSVSEEQALIAFNKAFACADTALLDQTRQEFLALKSVKNPRYQFDSATLTKMHDKLLSQDFSHFPLILPTELTTLSANSLLKLAFHPNGGHFYKYLQDVIHAEIFARTNYCAAFPNGEFTKKELHLLAAKINSLSTADFHERLNHSWPSTNVFYSKIESLFTYNLRQESDLLCTHHALEFLASTYLRNILLNRKLTGVTSDNGEQLIVAMELNLAEEKLLLLAATHGSYAAAYDLTLRAADRISQSSTLHDAITHYQHFYESLLLPSEQETPNLLLLVQVQLSFVNLCLEKMLAQASAAEEETQLWLSVHDQLLIDCYHTLLQAEQGERNCKNALRLAFNSDDCRIRLQQMLPRQAIGNTNTFDSIADIRQFFKQQYPHLRTAFSKPSPLLFLEVKFEGAPMTSSHMAAKLGF